jgi:sulfate adenylyltransferase subunit 1 (EFTu-like GTPase family)
VRRSLESTTGSTGLPWNDIARVSFNLAQPLCVDDYAEVHGGGAFILMDENSNDTVAAGMITANP